MNHDDRTLDKQIEAMMEQLTIEKAPASLSLRLNRIPEEESRKARLKKERWSWLKPGPFPRWALVPAFTFESVYQCDDALPSGGISWQTCHLQGPDDEVYVFHPLGGWHLLGERTQ